MLQLLRERSLDQFIADADALPGMARVRATTRLHLSMIEETLAASPYFAGGVFTAADVMMAFCFTTLLKFRPLDLSACPALRAYLARIGERPAYRRAMQVAGPGRKKISASS